MGLFSDMFKDISETGSSVGKLRNKFADLNKLLVEYSFNECRLSPELTKQKIIFTYNESIEIANKCNPTDRVRFYFPSRTLEPTVNVALKAGQYWVDFVLEERKQFTNSLAIQLIERAEHDLQNQPVSRITGTSASDSLSILLPNFVKFMNEISTVINNCHRITDNSTRIEYKSPILTYGRIMGYNHFIIEKNSSGKYEIFQTTISNAGKQLNTSKKIFSTDLPIETYDQLLNSIIKEMAVNPLYLQIAIGGF